MKIKTTLHLPDGKCFAVWYPDSRKWGDIEFANHVVELQRTFNRHESVYIDIIDENGNKETLILWGSVLKGSYIRTRLVE